jgi:hypothetical protein
VDIALGVLMADFSCSGSATTKNRSCRSGGAGGDPGEMEQDQFAGVEHERRAMPRRPRRRRHRPRRQPQEQPRHQVRLLLHQRHRLPYHPAEGIRLERCRSDTCRITEPHLPKLPGPGSKLLVRPHTIIHRAIDCLDRIVGVIVQVLCSCSINQLMCCLNHPSFFCVKKNRHVGFNALSGPIPKELGNLTNLNLL